MYARCNSFARFALLLSSFYCAHPGYAQSIENVTAVFQNGKVIVHYDLKADPNTSYVIELFGSHNNFTTPIQLAQGDVGKEVKPGLQKRLEWDVKNDLKNYKGEITIELKGEANLLPWAILQPTLKAGLRRGTTGTILWQGGKPSQEVKLELFQGTKQVQAITTSPIVNTKKYDWKLPTSLKPGSGYNIKLFSGSEGVTSASFKIGRKIPIVYTIVPAAVVGYFGGKALYNLLFPKPPVDPDLQDGPGNP